MPTPPKKRNTSTTVIEQPAPAAAAETPAIDLADLASALDAMDAGSETMPAFDEGDDALPDYVQSGSSAPLAPTPIAPMISAKAHTTTHAVIARELSGFKQYIGDSQRICVYYEDELGKRSLINEYGPKEVEAYGSVESFVQRVIARNYGGGGIFPIVGISANGKKFDLETVRIAKPTVDPKETTGMDMTRDLLEQLKAANERILEARANVPQPPNPLDQLERLEEFKRKAGGGDQTAMMMMMMMQQQQQQRGPDPAVAQLTSLVEKVMDRFARLEQVVMAPPPPPMPMPMGPDPMELVLRVAEVMRPAETRNPIDDLVKLKGLTQNEGALSVEKLVGTVIPQLMANVQQTTPFRERLEELTLMKKLMGSSDENPFTGILKSFMQSQLGAGLGSGLGDAIRARSAPQPVAAQPAALPAPQPPATPNLPTGYLSTFEPRLIAATDDGERVACVVDSLLALATDDHWGALSNVFLQATLQDDLVKVNQSLYKLFNAWAQSGSTIGKDKADAAIRAVNTSWDLIVTSLCKMMDHPIPETLRQRQFAAAAAAEKSTSNGQSGPSSPATSTPTSDAVSA
jgi:hypothetical protein